MIEQKIDFDLEKWRSYDRKIIQPYAKDIIRKSFKKHKINPKECVFRGGFGRAEDLQRLKETGSDYKELIGTTKDQKLEGAITYASLFKNIGCEPWVRGLDPLYWALRGHNGKEFNPVNVLAAFWKDRLIGFDDVWFFKTKIPSKDNLAALIYLNLINKQ